MPRSAHSNVAFFCFSYQKTMRQIYFSVMALGLCRMLITLPSHNIFSGKGLRYGNVVTGLGVAPYSALCLEKTEINNRTKRNTFYTRNLTCSYFLVFRFRGLVKCVASLNPIERSR